MTGPNDIPEYEYSTEYESNIPKDELIMQDDIIRNIEENFPDHMDSGEKIYIDLHEMFRGKFYAFPFVTQLINVNRVINKYKDLGWKIDKQDLKTCNDGLQFFRTYIFIK